MVFYFAVGLLSALLSVAELGHLVWKGRPRAAACSQAAERDNRCNLAHEEACGSCSSRCPPCPRGDRAPTLRPTGLCARGAGHEAAAGPAAGVAGHHPSGPGHLELPGAGGEATEAGLHHPGARSVSSPTVGRVPAPADDTMALQAALHTS